MKRRILSILSLLLLTSSLLPLQAIALAKAPAVDGAVFGFTDSQAQFASVAPARIPQTASQLCPVGTTCFRIESPTGNPPGTRTVSDGTVSMTLTYYQAGGPPASAASAVDWSLNTPGYVILYVLVMDGIDGGNIYDYRPNGMTSDTYLTTPGPSQGPYTFKDISHVDFCYVPAEQDQPAIEIVKSGALDMTVVDPDGQVNVGDEINYTFTVTNTGNITLTSVTVTDPMFPGPDAPVFASSSLGSPEGTLLPGESATYTASYAITQGDIDAGKVDNTATADSDESGPDDDDETVTLVQNPALTLVKSGSFNDENSDGYADVGETISYSFTVTNTDNIALTSVTVTDPMLPGPDAPVFASSSLGSPEGTLLPGESATYTASYAVTQDDIDAGKVDNTAAATGTPLVGAGVTDTAEETVDLTQEPDIEIVKSVSSTSAAPGATITYTIIYENTGQMVLTNVQIIDDPDENYVASVSNISDGGVYAGGVITWNIGSLNPGIGGSVTYNVTLLGASAFPVGTTTVGNVAVITSEETDPEDDDASVTVTITPPASGGGMATPSGEPTCFFDVDMLGEVTRVYVTCQEGRCRGNYEPEDPSQKNFLELAIGTRVTYNLDGQFNGGPPRWIRMRETPNPPPPAEGQVAVTPVYSFLGYTGTGLQTDSVFFDAVVGMQLDYDPDALPENTTSVGIAAWNPDTHQWEFLPQATGRVAGVGTATADVMHFSTFAVLATTGDAITATPAVVPTPPAPGGSRPAAFSGSNLHIEPAVERLWAPLTFATLTGNKVTITATIENAGGEPGTHRAELALNGEVVGSQDVSLAAGEQTNVRFILSRVAPGDYQVRIGELNGTFTSSRQVTWWLIVLIVIGAIGTGWLVLRRNRRRLIA